VYVCVWGGGSVYSVKKRLNDVHEEYPYESAILQIMWTAAGEDLSLGLACHLSKQRPHFSSHIALYRPMYRDETVWTILVRGTHIRTGEAQP
jgi:hypothetical protein